MFKKRRHALHIFLFIVGLFLHILLWDPDFLDRLARMSESWAAFRSVGTALWNWFNLYLIRGIGIWLVITALLMLFVILPILTRYRHIHVKAHPWLAVNVTVYLFVVLKMLKLY